MTHVFSTGRREVFELRLASGKTVRATANHPFLTYDGWRPLGDLGPGSPGRRPAARARRPRRPRTTWADEQVVLLAHLIGDGSFVKRQPIRYASIDEANLQAVTDAARHFGVTAVRDDYPAARCTTLRLPAPYRLTHGRRNPIAAWLDGLGLFGARSHEKFVPHEVFNLPKRQIALFLRHLWATDGSVTVNRVRPGPAASTTPRPAGGWSTTWPGCCCGSASPPGSGRCRPKTGLAGPATRSTSAASTTSGGSSRRSVSTGSEATAAAAPARDHPRRSPEPERRHRARRRVGPGASPCLSRRR